MKINGTELKMAKKYKNTVHKNPFRENRPKKIIPWKLIGIISASLALVITVTLVIRTVYGVRKLTLAEGGSFYDKRSGITYCFAPSSYQPAGYKNSVFATYGKAEFHQVSYRTYDESGTEYKDTYVSADKMITVVDDSVYQIYYNKDCPLPSLSEMDVKMAEIHEYGDTLSSYVGEVGEEQAKTLVTVLGDETLYKDRPEGLDWEASKMIVFENLEAYPELRYVVYYVSSADGTRYLTDNFSTWVPIGDLLSDELS